MIISLRNIGKLDSASIEIDGIAVIAGANNTGKSTVGRTLFAVFNSFYNVDEQIMSERVDSVSKSLLLLDRRMVKRLIRGVDTKEIAKDIVLHKESFCEDGRALRDKITDIILQAEESYDKSVFNSNVNDVVEEIQEILKIPDERIFKSVVEKKMNLEFNGQINNIFSNRKGEVELRIKNHSVGISIENNNVVEIANHMDLHTEAVYIDDPFILDESFFPYGRSFGYADHRMHLKEKLFFNDRGNSVVEEIIINDKIESIYDKISSVCEGELVRKKQMEFGYKKSDSDKVLDVRNLSTGLKTFAILKTLLINGTIECNGVIILDEPEIHLHPEWQLLFAELMVMLHKEFGIHVLLNTHSPYFLRAIQVYSAKYEVAEKCRYYLSEESENYVKVTDVSNYVESIYAKLSKPLQNLEDERWENG